MYILIITDETVHFRTRTVYGPFDNVENIKEWLKDKFNNSSYSIDIHPLIRPNDINNENMQAMLD